MLSGYGSRRARDPWSRLHGQAARRDGRLRRRRHPRFHNARRGPVFDRVRLDALPTVDADRDGVWDGDDKCETIPNPDQRDVDVDYVGDVCDTYDNRPALTLLGELWGETKSISNGNKLAAKLDHAITALQAGQVSVACTDVAGYISQMQSARGKTIPAATADTLIPKARHIRTVLAC